MKTKRFVFVGLFIIAVAMISNLNWAMSDYGIRSISLNPRVLAQEPLTAGPNDSIKNGNDGGTGYYIDEYACEITIHGDAGGKGRFLGVPIKFDANGKLSVRVEGAKVLCRRDGPYETCNQMTCGEFWLKAGGVIYDNGNGQSNDKGTGTSIDKKDSGTN